MYKHTLFRDKKTWIAGTGIVLGIIFLYWFTFSRPLPPPPPPPPPPPNKDITNPDYLKNPSAYLVDFNNIIPTNPRGNTLWVEGVVNSHTLKISYVINRAEEKILKVEKLLIPGLGDPGGNRSILWGQARLVDRVECWENATMKFLQTNFLHTRVYFTNTGPSKSYMLSYSDGTMGQRGYLDLVDYVIKNGYGSLDSPESTTRISVRYTPYSPQSPQSRSYFNRLESVERVASLAERGLWGECETRVKS